MQNSNNPSRRSRPSSQNENASSSPGSQSAPQKSFSSEIPSEEIARRAYSRWEDSDRSHGRDQDHWFAAENELRRGPSGRSGRNDESAETDDTRRSDDDET